MHKRFPPYIHLEHISQFIQFYQISQPLSSQLILVGRIQEALNQTILSVEGIWLKYSSPELQTYE